MGTIRSFSLGKIVAHTYVIFAVLLRNNADRMSCKQAHLFKENRKAHARARTHATQIVIRNVSVASPEKPAAPVVLMIMNVKRVFWCVCCVCEWCMRPGLVNGEKCFCMKHNDHTVGQVEKRKRNVSGVDYYSRCVKNEKSPIHLRFCNACLALNQINTLNLYKV